MPDQYIYRPNRRADMRMWCGFCQEWFPIDDYWDGSCPRCGMTITEFKCTRCGHMWTPKANLRRHGMPASCPRCKSPYWNRERCRDPVTGRWYRGGPKERYAEMRRQRDEYNRTHPHSPDAPADQSDDKGGE